MITEISLKQKSTKLIQIFKNFLKRFQKHSFIYPPATNQDLVPLLQDKIDRLPQIFFKAFSEKVCIKYSEYDKKILLYPFLITENYEWLTIKIISERVSKTVYQRNPELKIHYENGSWDTSLFFALDYLEKEIAKAIEKREEKRTKELEKDKLKMSKTVAKLNKRFEKG